MSIEIAEYDVFFILPHLEEKVMQQIKQMAEEGLGFKINISPQFLEFHYSGRDTGRRIVNFLCSIAPLIGTAEAEAECHITTDTDDSYFEFYSIQDGRLYKQEAKIVRMPPVEVCLEKPETNRQTVSVG